MNSAAAISNHGPWSLINGDARRIPLRDDSVHCVVTSPPYFALRDYGVAGQIGLEPTPEAFIDGMVKVFREVRRVLRNDGTVWVNMGDSYNAGTSSKRKAPKTSVDVGGWNDAEIDGGARVKFPGLKPKDLCNVPHRLVLALQADGWWHRDTIIWHKPNPMPSSVTDRTTTAHEYIFLLCKSARYFYDADAVREEQSAASLADHLRRKPSSRSNGCAPDRGPGDKGLRMNGVMVSGSRNKRSVWRVSTEACKASHFATFPQKLITPCILAGTSAKGCCPACGAPWRRVVEKVRVATRPGDNSKVAEARKFSEEPGRSRGAARFERSTLATIVGNRDPQRHVSSTVSETWVPGCKCGAELTPVPCTVFDPFAGAGTTLIVAARHGRRGIGLELNPAYIDIARNRIVAELAKPVKKPKKRRPQVPGQLMLNLGAA